MINLDTKTALSLMIEKGYLILETITCTTTDRGSTIELGYTCEKCGHKKEQIKTPYIKTNMSTYTNEWYFDGNGFACWDGNEITYGFTEFTGEISIHPNYLKNEKKESE